MSEALPIEARTVRSIEELARLAGQEIGVGPWREVTQAQVDAFLQALMGDGWRAAWLYTDPERAAREAPFGGTILPGNMTLSLATLVPTDPRGEGYVIAIPYKLVINYGYDRVRWVSPVRVGSRIRSRNQLIALEEVRPQVFQMRSQVTVEIKGEAKPAMVGENLTWFYM